MRMPKIQTTVLGALTRRKNIEDTKNFVRYSSIATFVHHGVVLLLIVILALYDPIFFPHWNSSDFQLKPSYQAHFFAVFGCVFLIGICSLAANLHRAQNIAEVDADKFLLDNVESKCEENFNTECNRLNSIDLENEYSER